MDFTFLNRAFSSLRARTFDKMNVILTGYAITQEMISSEKQRMDTTVYETNIHYPTDYSLLWDSFRTLARLVSPIQNELPQLDLRHRFHDKKVKNLATFIARNASSKSKETQREIKRNYTTLINRVRWIHRVGQQVCKKAFAAGYDVPGLSHYLPLVEKIIDQRYRRIIKGGKVPADQKIYSLFEAHTELSRSFYNS